MSFQVSDEGAARKAAPAPGAAGRTPPASPPMRGGAWRSLARTREAALALLILVVVGLLALAEPKVLSASNLLAVGTGMIYDLPVAAGMTLVMILGGIDLSVGAVLGLTGVVTAMSLRSGTPVPLAVLLGCAAAAGVGAFNGLLVARFGVASFIVTLGTMSIARGAATVLTSGYYLSGLPAAYIEIGRGQLLGVPYPIFAVLGLLVLFDFLLKRWKPLHDAFYAGHNPAAASLSGIAVGRLVFAGFVASALLAGVSAVFMTSRLAMGYARFGELAELRAIAACVLGGASFSGGSGSILGTALGVLLLAVILNGFVLLNISVYWQGVVSGSILVVAIALDAYRRRRTEAR
ncbi:MAG: ABC transporter permease [Armatimonadetes bacterium]|nr:ABC transporter permease [Armatimonadota bacterium]